MRPGFCERSHRSVKLAHYCGLVTTGHRVLEILPKIDSLSTPDSCRGLLLRLLRKTSEFPIFRHLPVGQQLRHAPLIEVFISAFFDATTQVVRGGLLRQYREHEEDLAVIRGRILSARQFAIHSNRPDRIACRFDELTPDNVWNRLVKAALHAVRPWIRRAELSRRWVELAAVFEEVDDSQVGARDLDGLVFDRHAVRYRTVVDWVRWILALLSPKLRAGKDTSPALLFDINLLFQSAVAEHCRREASRHSDVQVHSQETTAHLATLVRGGGRREFDLRPDLILRRNDEIVLVADTKWKRLEIRGSGHIVPNTADVYQLHAYGAALKCKHLALIYPWHPGLRGSKETAFELPRVGDSQPLLSVVCLDLESDEFKMMRGLSVPWLATILGTVNS